MTGHDAQAVRTPDAPAKPSLRTRSLARVLGEGFSGNLTPMATGGTDHFAGKDRAAGIRIEPSLADAPDLNGTSNGRRRLRPLSDATHGETMAHRMDEIHTDG